MTRDQLVGQIRGWVADLVDVRHHIEPILDDNGHGNRRLRRVYPSKQPSLVSLLRETAHEGLKVGGGSPVGRKPSSRPPGCFDALNALVYIGARAAAWCDVHHVARPEVEDNLRALVGLAPTLDDTDLGRLFREVRYWHGMAAAASGWAERPYTPPVSCPVCSRFGSLRLNIEARAGYCTNRERDRYGDMVCGAAWKPNHAEPLFAYIRAELGVQGVAV